MWKFSLKSQQQQQQKAKLEIFNKTIPLSQVTFSRELESPRAVEISKQANLPLFVCTRGKVLKLQEFEVGNLREGKSKDYSK